MLAVGLQFAHRQDQFQRHIGLALHQERRYQVGPDTVITGVGSKTVAGRLLRGNCLVKVQVGLCKDRECVGRQRLCSTRSVDCRNRLLGIAALP